MSTQGLGINTHPTPAISGVGTRGSAHVGSTEAPPQDGSHPSQPPAEQMDLDPTHSHPSTKPSPRWVQLNSMEEHIPTGLRLALSCVPANLSYFILFYF